MSALQRVHTRTYTSGSYKGHKTGRQTYPRICTRTHTHAQTRREREHPWVHVRVYSVINSVKRNLVKLEERLDLCLSVFLSLPVCLSLPVSLSLYLSVSLCLSLSLSLSLSTCLSVSACLSLQVKLSKTGLGLSGEHVLFLIGRWYAVWSL